MKGIQFAGIESGVKAKGLDLGLVYFNEPADVVSLYTRNEVKAAHILYNQRYADRRVRALLVNSGCANACTGVAGVNDLIGIAQALAVELHIDRKEILFASTGVIGKRLPADAIIKALPRAVRSLSEANQELFAQAITTTDTYPKMVEGRVKGDKKCAIVGIAKGSGMINPLFATMLAFFFTDCPVGAANLKKLLPVMGKESFERITVDGDTSTNDTVMVFAPGKPAATAFPSFRDAIAGLMKELAYLIVKDGEGATKVVHITVRGVRRADEAERIARRIACSPLVKTAFFGNDPNWGRIICAAGDADVPVDQSKVEITMQGETLVKDGMEVDFSEQKLKKLMDAKKVDVVLDLHAGRASYDIYTTDLTYGYIKINASYRS
jgi:glutamate N-acetyltransferase / amino-acid N-acetyltransferase